MAYIFTGVISALYIPTVHPSVPGGDSGKVPITISWNMEFHKIAVFPVMFKLGLFQRKNAWMEEECTDFQIPWIMIIFSKKTPPTMVLNFQSIMYNDLQRSRGCSTL